MKKLMIMVVLMMMVSGSIISTANAITDKQRDLSMKVSFSILDFVAMEKADNVPFDETRSAMLSTFSTIFQDVRSYGLSKALDAWVSHPSVRKADETTQKLVLAFLFYSDATLKANPKADLKDLRMRLNQMIVSFRNRLDDHTVEQIKFELAIVFNSK
jgi:hypothetical protein